MQVLYSDALDAAGLMSAVSINDSLGFYLDSSDAVHGGCPQARTKSVIEVMMLDKPTTPDDSAVSANRCGTQ